MPATPHLSFMAVTISSSRGICSPYQWTTINFGHPYGRGRCLWKKATRQAFKKKLVPQGQQPAIRAPHQPRGTLVDRICAILLRNPLRGSNTDLCNTRRYSHLSKAPLCDLPKFRGEY